MKRTGYAFFVLAAAASMAVAQTSTPAKPATATKSATAARSGAASAGKLPPGIPPVKGVVKVAFSERYEEIKVGTGPLAEPYKLYKVHYTGWLASTGRKFDSSFDHPDAKPIEFPQGSGRVIPGWDRGFEGMHVGGKRRIFIPYQLGYGERGVPDRDATHPGIPPKSDLIFDVELLEVNDMPPPQQRGPMGARPGMMPHPMPGQPGATGQPTAPKPAAVPPPASAPATPPPAATPAPAPKPADPAAPKAN